MSPRTGVAAGRNIGGAVARDPSPGPKTKPPGAVAGRFANPDAATSRYGSEVKVSVVV